MSTLKAASLLSGLLCLACFVGCGPNDGLCQVDGTVTLDGQPLESGRINMGPMVGNPGTAVGGDIINGAFSIRASEGEMAVTIRSQKKVAIDDPTPDELAHNVTERLVEQIPEKYNQKSELKCTIAPGKNTVNFDLVSEAK